WNVAKQRFMNAMHAWKVALPPLPGGEPGHARDRWRRALRLPPATFMWRLRRQTTAQAVIRICRKPGERYAHAPIPPPSPRSIWGDLNRGRRDRVTRAMSARLIWGTLIVASTTV